MFYGRAYAFWSFAVLTALTLSAVAQSVISTHSGVVHFFEGSVSVAGQPLEPHLGRFPTVPLGAELSTAKGRAELLLTPGVFLRLGENTAIRMVANTLADTRLELLSGSTIVDSGGPIAGTSVTLIYKTWSMRFVEQGIYRLDSDPARLRVIQGKAEVSGSGNDGAISVKQGMDLPFAAVLVPSPSIDPARDALSNWADGRRQSISADNAIAANIQDPASIDASGSGVDAFTNFPMLGLSYSGTGLSAYNSLGLYQPGFNSLYLPGYTYLPMFLGVGPGPWTTRYPFPVRTPPIRRPPHAGILPYPPPRIPVPHPTQVHPITPPPVMVHPGAPGGMHGSIHR